VSASSSFATYAVELLSGVGPVRARAMFGGHGLYLGSLFIAVVVEDRLYLRVDDLTRPRFQAAGSEPWVYPSKNGTTTMNAYWSLPESAVDDAEEASAWGRLALEATCRKDAARASKKKPTAKAAPTRGAAARKSTATATTSTTATSSKRAAVRRSPKPKPKSKLKPSSGKRPSRRR
jgi:DNA transformation protein